VGNTRARYGTISVFLHWTMALLMVGLAAVGLYMTRLPDTAWDSKKVWLTIYHKEFGILALVLGLMRLGWKVSWPEPRLIRGVPEWQLVAAKFVQLCFYALMFALPLSGWLMTSAAAIPVSFFGLFYLPDLVNPNDVLFHFLVKLHHALGWSLLVFLVLHAGAALHHHFVLRDATLRRMIP
jgi:cytochrome b561